MQAAHVRMGESANSDVQRKRQGSRWIRVRAVTGTCDQLCGPTVAHVYVHVHVHVHARVHVPRPSSGGSFAPVPVGGGRLDEGGTKGLEWVGMKGPVWGMDGWMGGWMGKRG